jgi:hypothetical protein
MAKQKNDWFIIITFIIIWFVRPISYQEVRSRHPPQENLVKVNSSFISNQNEELDCFEITTKDIILAKDSSSNFFS